MSTTKKWIEAERDAARAEEKENCGCYFDPEHSEAEMFERWREERETHEATIAADEATGIKTFEDFSKKL